MSNSVGLGVKKLHLRWSVDTQQQKHIYFIGLESTISGVVVSFGNSSSNSCALSAGICCDDPTRVHPFLMSGSQRPSSPVGCQLSVPW